MRPERDKKPNAVYFISNDTVAQEMFFNQRWAQEIAQQAMAETLKRYGCTIMSEYVGDFRARWVIDTNGDQDISFIMKHVKQLITQRYNIAHGDRKGTIWADRFTSEILETTDAITDAIKDIHLMLQEDGLPWWLVLALYVASQLSIWDLTLLFDRDADLVSTQVAPAVHSKAVYEQSNLELLSRKKVYVRASGSYIHVFTKAGFRRYKEGFGVDIE